MHESAHERGKKYGEHGGHWIGKLHLKRGALHKEMGIPEGKKIPAKRLAAAAKKGGKEGRRARLAETLKGLRK
jgi:hypothetical protein